MNIEEDRVSSLMNHNNRTWDEDKVDVNFNAIDAERIKKLRLSWRYPDDALY